jgi:hypothetical protein
MRRSTPGIGEGDQLKRAAWTTARRVKSALISTRFTIVRQVEASKIRRLRDAIICARATAIVRDVVLYQKQNRFPRFLMALLHN